MTLDEAIRRYTNNAEYERIHGSLQGCLDFRQLAEWLKDYKQLLEQKSGKWIPIPYELDYETDAECSLCHEKFIDAINYDYCPKCGYRMQKSEDEG